MNGGYGADGLTEVKNWIKYLYGNTFKKTFDFWYSALL